MRIRDDADAQRRAAPGAAHHLDAADLKGLRLPEESPDAQEPEWGDRDESDPRKPARHPALLEAPPEAEPDKRRPGQRANPRKKIGKLHCVSPWSQRRWR